MSDDPFAKESERLHEHAARLSHDRGADPVREAAMAFMSHVQSLACDHGTNAGTHTTCPEAMTLYAALSVPAPTLPALDAETLARALIRAMPGFQRYMAYPATTHNEAEVRIEVMEAEARGTARALCLAYEAEALHDAV